MKKILLYIIVLSLGLLISTSCEKEEIGGTAAVKMAGEWYVLVDCVDESGEVVYSDAQFFGIGRFHLDTYNTSENSTEEMWVDDHGNFWEFKVKMAVDMDGMTFQASEAQNVAYDCKVTIEDGKILYGATKTPGGAVADSVVFYVNFDDDTYPSDYGFDKYRVSGFRYTGLTSDD